MATHKKSAKSAKNTKTLQIEVDPEALENFRKEAKSLRITQTQLFMEFMCAYKNQKDEKAVSNAQRQDKLNAQQAMLDKAHSAIPINRVAPLPPEAYILPQPTSNGNGSFTC
jgi:hypothetical protein